MPLLRERPPLSFVAMYPYTILDGTALQRVYRCKAPHTRCIYALLNTHEMEVSSLLRVIVCPKK